MTWADCWPDRLLPPLRDEATALLQERVRAPDDDIAVQRSLLEKSSDLVEQPGVPFDSGERSPRVG